MVDHFPIQGTWVWSLVEDLRSHMPWGNTACTPQRAGTAKKKTKIDIRSNWTPIYVPQFNLFFLNKIRKLFLWTKLDKNAVSFVNLDISEPFVKPPRRYLIISKIPFSANWNYTLQQLCPPPCPIPVTDWAAGSSCLSWYIYFYHICSLRQRIFSFTCLILGSY